MPLDRGDSRDRESPWSDILLTGMVGGLGYAVLIAFSFVWIRGDGLPALVAGTEWHPFLYAGYVIVGALLVGALPTALYWRRGLRSPLIGLIAVFVSAVIVTYRSHRSPGPAQDRVHWDVFILEYWFVLVAWLVVLAALEAVLWPRLVGTVTERTSLEAPDRRDFVRAGGYTLVGGVLVYILLDLFTDYVDGPGAPDPICVSDPNEYYEPAAFDAFDQLGPDSDSTRVRPPYWAAGDVISYAAAVADEPVDELPDSPVADILQPNHRATGMIRGGVPHYAEERVAAWAIWGATIAVVEQLDTAVEDWRNVNVSYHFRGNKESPPEQYDWDITSADWEHPEVIVLTFRIRCRVDDQPQLHGHPGIAFSRFIETVPAAVEAEVTMGEEHYVNSIPVVVEWRYSTVRTSRAN